MNAWVAVLAAGIVSFLIRLLPVAALSTRPAPELLSRAGALVAPVAFAALAATAVAGSAAAGPVVLVPRVVAISVAGFVAYRTRSTAATVASGMVVLWLAAALAGSR